MRSRYLRELAIAVVTLGLYMPVWLHWRDAEVRGHLPGIDGMPAAWALGSGMALGVIARAVFGATSPDVALALGLLGVVVFLLGFHQVADRLAGGAQRLDGPDPLSPLLATSVLGLVFFGIEMGNAVETWLVRGPFLVLVLALPYVFWRLHLSAETVRAIIPEEENGEAASAAGPTS